MVGIVLALLVGCSPAGHSDQPVLASISHCGQGWSPSSAGPQRLLIHNADTRPGEVMLTGAATGAVFGYLEPLAAGTTAELTADLGPGRYRLRCAMEDESVVDGPVVTIHGPAGATTRGVIPVSQADLIKATQQYQAYVTGQLPALARQTDTLAADIGRGDLAAARRDWLPAHLSYERLGAAYGAFGALDTVINGTTAGLPGGRADTHWTGFHRLEYGLWHGQSSSELVGVAAALDRAVRRLTPTFAHAQIKPSEVAIRAHEITENAIQFELTGRTDYGSHSNLATVAANLAGTRIVLGLLRPLLAGRYPDLARTYAALAAAQRAAAGPRALSSLTRSQRENLNARLGALVELLAPVAEICEPRRTS